MKIALVSPYDYDHPGGVTNHVLALAKEYTKLGHEVKILAPASNQHKKDSQHFVRMGRALAIPVFGTVVRISPSLRLSPKINEVLNSENFDIIHLHEPFMPMLCSAVLKYSNTVNVGTFHACNGKPGYWFGKPISTWMLNSRNKKISGRIAVSNAAKRYASRFVDGTFSIIPNGVDLELFNPNVKPFEQYKDDKINIVFVGRFEKRKGAIYLIKAFEILKKSNDNIRLIMVGPGTVLKEKYEKYINKHLIKDVEFIGGVKYEDLPRWYQTGDIFCSPATGQESFGMVLIEAMAVGKPIVASANEGYSQVVHDGKEGYLVKPKRPNEIAVKLNELIQNEELRNIMGNEGLKTAKQYNWPIIAHKLLQYYTDAINASKHNKAIF